MVAKDTAGDQVDFSRLPKDIFYHLIFPALPLKTLLALTRVNQAFREMISTDILLRRARRRFPDKHIGVNKAIEKHDLIHKLYSLYRFYYREKFIKQADEIKKKFQYMMDHGGLPKIYADYPEVAVVLKRSCLAMEFEFFGETRYGLTFLITRESIEIIIKNDLLGLELEFNPLNLLQAAKFGDLNALKLIIDKKEFQSWEIKKAFEESVMNGYVDIAGYFLANQFPVSIIYSIFNRIMPPTGHFPYATEYKLSLLNCAIFNNDIEMVELLLWHGADSKNKYVEIECVGLDNYNIKCAAVSSPLHYAVVNGQEEIITMMFAHGDCINQPSKFNTTLLIAALMNNRLHIASLLIQLGVDIDGYDEDEETALTWASSNGRLSIVKFLLQKGAWIDKPEKVSLKKPIECAIENKHTDVFMELLNGGSGLWFMGRDIFREIDNLPYLNVLLARGMAVNRLTKSGESDPDPINEAANAGNQAAVLVLIKYGADINFYLKILTEALHDRLFRYKNYWRKYEWWDDYHVDNKLDRYFDAFLGIEALIKANADDIAKTRVKRIARPDLHSDNEEDLVNVIREDKSKPYQEYSTPLFFTKKVNRGTEKPYFDESKLLYEKSRIDSYYKRITNQ